MIKNAKKAQRKPAKTQSVHQHQLYRYRELENNWDDYLAQQLRYSIHNDLRIPYVDRSRIHIEVLNQIVLLSGMVNNILSKMLAFGDALCTNGVYEVENHIVLRHD